MGETTGISWCDSTFNAWIGCMKVSEACTGCYAEAMMGMGGRYKRVEWGAPGKGIGTRVRTSTAYWRQPVKWNKLQELKVKAWEAAGRPANLKPAAHFVFCCSLADVFDNHPDVAPWRRELFDLIRATPHLTWLLLTKRPQNIIKMATEALTVGELDGEPVVADFPKNIILMCTVVTQEEVDRDVPKLLEAKTYLNATACGVSMEPLLEPVWLKTMSPDRMKYWDYLTGEIGTMYPDGPDFDQGEKLDWVIVGGETDQGPHKARVTDPNAIRRLRDQCARAGVPFQLKQWGEVGPVASAPREGDEIFFRPHENGSGLERVTFMRRLGKHYTGRLLDGVLHDARPVL